MLSEERFATDLAARLCEQNGLLMKGQPAPTFTDREGRRDPEPRCRSSRIYRAIRPERTQLSGRRIDPTHRGEIKTLFRHGLPWAPGDRSRFRNRQWRRRRSCSRNRGRIVSISGSAYDRRRHDGAEKRNRIEGSRSRSESADGPARRTAFLRPFPFLSVARKQLASHAFTRRSNMPIRWQRALPSRKDSPSGNRQA